MFRIKSFCLWDVKDNLSYLLFQIKMRYFFRPFSFPTAPSSQSRNPISLLPFNQLLALKRVQMYETFFTIQIYTYLFFIIIWIYLLKSTYLIVIKVINFWYFFDRINARIHHYINDSKIISFISGCSGRLLRRLHAVQSPRNDAAGNKTLYWDNHIQ